MLCVNPKELCVITFIPTSGDRITERRDAITEALQGLVEYWSADPVRVFWVDVGTYPDAERKLGVSSTRTTSIAFSSVEDTYSTLPVAFSPQNMDAWVQDLIAGKGVNLKEKPQGEIVLLGKIL